MEGGTQFQSFLVGNNTETPITCQTARAVPWTPTLAVSGFREHEGANCS